MSASRARRWRSWGAAVALLLLDGCAGHEPAVDPTPAVASPTMRLGLMYWAPPTHVLEAGDGLVFVGEVLEHAERPSEHPELRGPTVTEVTLRVERVLQQLDPPSAEAPPPRLAAGDRVWTDGAEGLAVGDRVLVLASTYDGGYGVVPVTGTGTPIGIVLAGPSDPVVPAMQRVLDGSVDWSSEDDLAVWRPYGEAAIECMRRGEPIRHCASD